MVLSVHSVVGGMGQVVNTYLASLLWPTYGGKRGYKERTIHVLKVWLRLSGSPSLPKACSPPLVLTAPSLQIT